MSWYDDAKQLKIGTSKRYQHCGKPKSAIISHKREGYTMYCFKCGEPFFKPRGELTQEEMRVLRKQESDAERQLSTLNYPADAIRLEDVDIPDGRIWIMKAGISLRLAHTYGIRWLTKSQRVFLPVYKDERLVYHQARKVMPNKGMKYINPKVDRAKVFFKSHWLNTSNVVVTEDILSAIRVGEVMSAWSALGTVLSEAQAVELAKTFDEVIIWLDPDEAGIAAASKMVKLLSPLVKTRTVKSDKDPKYYTHHEIEEILA